MIEEVIVVEGKDDIQAVKRAVDCEVIATHGFGFDEGFLCRLKNIAGRKGIIVLTDPDYAGERIRTMISRKIPEAKHAYLPRDLAIKNADIGVENAEPEAILEALRKAKPRTGIRREEFTMQDMIENGLTGSSLATGRREKLGNALGIGYCNTKQLLQRLNHFDITREEFEKAMEEIRGN